LSHSSSAIARFRIRTAHGFAVSSDRALRRRWPTASAGRATVVAKILICRDRRASRAALGSELLAQHDRLADEVTVKPLVGRWAADL